MPETSLTIAVRLAQEMEATHQPNTGQLQEGSPIPAKQVTAVWYSNQPKNIDFSIRVWDASETHSQATGLVDPNAIGCTVALISYMCSEGTPLNQIAGQAALDPYTSLASIYGDGLWDDFWYNWNIDVHPELAANQGAVVAMELPTNDPFHVWLPQ